MGWRPRSSRRAPTTLRERSTHSIIQSHVDIKTWRAAVPDVDQVRPARCPCCDAASRPVGGPLVLRGHGLRLRQVLGPLVAGGPAQMVTVQVRRYRCTACRAIITVAPRGVLRRRLYSASAIGWVLARLGLDGAATAQVRAEVSPSKVTGHRAVDRWITAARWLEASRSGELFPRLGPHAASSRRRQIAERTAMQLVALAPCGGTTEILTHAAFAGAALAA